MVPKKKEIMMMVVPKKKKKTIPKRRKGLWKDRVPPPFPSDEGCS